MPVTILETKEVGARPLIRVYQHSCSLGEFEYKLKTLTNAAVIHRLLQSKERFNWFDIMQEVGDILDHDPTVECNDWQFLDSGRQVSADRMAAIRSHNANPKAFKMKEAKEEETE